MPLPPPLNHGATPLSTAWTQDIKDPEKKKNFEDLVRNSVMVLSKMKIILEDMEREINSSTLSLSDFKDPNWSHKEAFRHGDLSRIKKIKDLIPF